jgi:hypothetical protein
VFSLFTVAVFFIGEPRLFQAEIEKDVAGNTRVDNSNKPWKRLDPIMNEPGRRSGAWLKYEINRSGWQSGLPSEFSR